MKIVILFLASVGLCIAGRLDNTYLPPSSAQFAGGSGGILNAPGASSYYRGGGGIRPGGGAGFGAGIRPAGFGAGIRPAGVGVGAFGRPYVRTGEAAAEILRYNNENYGDGTYQYEYETTNGIYAQERGQLQYPGTNAEQEVVTGSYSYTGPDGRVYTVRYTADADGFHPEGDHLPTPPPIPEAILRSLERNAAEEARGGVISPQYGAPVGGGPVAPIVPVAPVVPAPAFRPPYRRPGVSRTYLPPTGNDGYRY